MFSLTGGPNEPLLRDVVNQIVSNRRSGGTTFTESAGNISALDSM